MILENDFNEMEGAALEHFVLEVFKQGDFNFPYRRLVQGKKTAGYF